MQRILAAVAICAACGSPSDPGDAKSKPKPLVFEPWSPPQHTSYDIFLASHGGVIVLSQRYSTDDGATWSALDPRLGRPSRVALTAGTVALWTPELGLARWVPATSAITAVAGEPSFAAERTWRVDPLTGRFIAFDPIENAIASETPSGWTMAALPQPSPTEARPYVKDVESNGTTLLAVSAWGVHRSIDAGVSWQLASAPLADAGRDLLVLSDGRFALVGGTVAYLFDSTGAPAGTAPAGLRVDNDEAFACENNTIITHGKLTRDLGATWQPLVDAGELAIVAERGSCGGGQLWVLARSTAWGYRLLRFDGAATAGVVAGNWEPGAPAWN
nr:hypothetical protein [Myxococcota bacterium]